jgi:hypothetical protein
MFGKTIVVGVPDGASRCDGCVIFASRPEIGTGLEDPGRTELFRVQHDPARLGELRCCFFPATSRPT